jgi:DNA (cytosine-5)-methyltransferase 1
MSSFYNDNDPFAVEWMRNLIRDGVIDDGRVDDRSVTEISAADVLGYRHCHFFAGIAGWAKAFRIAGLTGVSGVWSASLPCQPVSSAGKRHGASDERHMWPEFYPLISECKPAAIFGEQSASHDGRDWIDGVSLDLEELDYAVAAADLPACSVAAPHKRQRLYWVAWNTDTQSEFARWCRASVGDAMCTRLEGLAGNGDAKSESRRKNPQQNRPASETGPWYDFRIVTSGDGKSRRIGAGVEPVDHGIPASVAHVVARLQQLGHSPAEAKRIVSDARANRKGRIRGYGNAIVPELAATFIRAARESISNFIDPTC